MRAIGNGSCRFEEAAKGEAYLVRYRTAVLNRFAKCLADQRCCQALEHYACDELCGFLTACALMRPSRLEGMKAKSVRKKMKQASFAAAVNRQDIINGAEDLGIELNEHIDFCIAAMQTIAADLDLVAES